MGEDDKQRKPVSVRVVHPQLAKGFDASRVPGPCTITSFVKAAPVAQPVPDDAPTPPIVDGVIFYAGVEWVTAERGAMMVDVEIGNFRNIAWREHLPKRRIPGYTYRTFYQRQAIEQFGATYKKRPRKQ